MQLILQNWRLAMDRCRAWLLLLQLLMRKQRWLITLGLLLELLAGHVHTSIGLSRQGLLLLLLLLLLVSSLLLLSVQATRVNLSVISASQIPKFQTVLYIILFCVQHMCFQHKEASQTPVSPSDMDDSCGLKGLRSE